MEWKADLTEVNGLKGWYKKQPRKVQTACSRMLNAFAYGTRTEAIAVINDVMTVRNKGFVSRQLRYTKTSAGLPIGGQRSWAGSVATERFSGWTEQEKGARTNQKRLATLAGRGGDKTKQIRQSVRLKRTNAVVTSASQDYRPRGGIYNVSGFLAMAKRKGETRIMRIGKIFFKRQSSKFKIVQMLRKKQPKRVHWLRMARAIYFKKTNLDKMWADTVRPLMGKPGKV